MTASVLRKNGKIFHKSIRKKLLQKGKNRNLQIRKTHAEKILSTPAIYKTRNTGIGNGLQGTREMLGNLLVGSGEYHQFNIWAYVIKGSRVCKNFLEFNYCFFISFFFLSLFFLFMLSEVLITVRRGRSIKKLQLNLNLWVQKTSKAVLF